MRAKAFFTRSSFLDCVPHLWADSRNCCLTGPLISVPLRSSKERLVSVSCCASVVLRGSMAECSSKAAESMTSCGQWPGGLLFMDELVFISSVVSPVANLGLLHISSCPFPLKPQPINPQWHTLVNWNHSFHSQNLHLYIFQNAFGRFPNIRVERQMMFFTFSVPQLHSAPPPVYFF